MFTVVGGNKDPSMLLGLSGALQYYILTGIHIKQPIIVVQGCDLTLSQSRSTKKHATAGMKLQSTILNHLISCMSGGDCLSAFWDVGLSLEHQQTFISICVWQS